MRIQACLNGARTPDEHASLPVTPETLAHAARAALHAGAESFHVHPRAHDASQSLQGSDIAAAVAAIRAACPGVPVGVTTIATIAPETGQRVALINGWTVLPDFASVNFSEDGAGEVCAALLARGVGIEAGLSVAEDARLLVQLGLAEQCTRLLLEPDDEELDAALATVAAIEHAVDAAAITTPRLLHGINATAWPLLTQALERGLATRIGFEDTLAMPDGTPAASNAQLVARAVEQANRTPRTIG